MLPHISNISNYTNGAMVHGARCTLTRGQARCDEGVQRAPVV